MTPELDKKLVEDFPILYQSRYGDMRTTAMVWGFPGDGWEPIIRKLSEKIENYNREHLDSPVVAVQCKEKFAALRFYVSHYPTEVEEWIEEAERESEDTCEFCGKAGRIRRDLGWLLTLCDKCHKERKKRYD
jgi:hypothetical protein